MTGLETAFYIVALICMSLLLLLLIAIAASLVIISRKISALHAAIDEKISTVTSIVHKGSSVVDALKKVATKTKK